MRPEEVIARRRSERERLLDRARRFAAQLDGRMAVGAVVVVGSVARGDFNDDSDVDVLVIADGLPERALDRLDALGRPPRRVEAVAWTPQEWRQERDRNPMAVEAVEQGVWLVGSPETAAGGQPNAPSG